MHQRFATGRGPGILGERRVPQVKVDGVQK